MPTIALDWDFLRGSIDKMDEEEAELLYDQIYEVRRMQMIKERLKCKSAKNSIRMRQFKSVYLFFLKDSLLSRLLFLSSSPAPLSRTLMANSNRMSGMILTAADSNFKSDC